MIAFPSSVRLKCLAFAQTLSLVAVSAIAGTAASAQEFQPGNLVVSRSVYKGHAATVQLGEVLPPGCTGSLCAGTTGAIADGTYPYVFNNDTYDSSFGITSPIYLDEITPRGFLVRTLAVPNSLMEDMGKESNQLVTSFSSKSELALHLSTDSKYLTFMGYVAPANAIDVSNSNTAGAVDPTNPVGESVYRAVGPLIGSATSHSPRPTPIAETTGVPQFSTTRAEPTSFTPPEMPATAPIRSQTE
jgi:hypothetical protein